MHDASLLTSTTTAIRDASPPTLPSLRALPEGHPEVHTHTPVFLGWDNAVTPLPKPNQLWFTADPETNCKACQPFVQYLLDLLKNGNAPGYALRLVCNQIKTPEKRELCFDLGTKLIDKVKYLVDVVPWTLEDYCSFLWQCEIDCCSSDKPEQVVMLLGDTDRDRLISWVSRGAEKQYLQLSLTSEFVDGDTNITTYPSTMIKYELGGWRGMIYRVYIPALFLKAQTTYYYRVGGSAAGGWSETFSFTTPSAALGTDAAPLRVMAFGDMDMTERSATVRDYMVSSGILNQLDAVVLLGDNGYADAKERLHAPWMTWLQATFTRRGIPLMVVMGNHEGLLWWDFGGATPRLPRRDGNVLFDKYAYSSTKMGTAHFQLLLSEHNIAMNTADVSEEQQAWIRKDLAGSTAQWHLAAFHRPMYCSSLHDDSCGDTGVYLREIFEPLFDSKMDVVLTAHHHRYERTTMVKNNRGIPHACQMLHHVPKAATSGGVYEQQFEYVAEVCKQGQGTLYVQPGNGGNSHSAGEVSPFLSPYSAQHTIHAGFSIITITSDFLKQDYHNAIEGRIIDTVVVEKKE